METSRRVNHRIIAISKIDIIDGQVQIHYAVFPLYMCRVAIYQIQEIEDHILNRAYQKANSLEFLFEQKGGEFQNFNDQMTDEIAEFHYAQCSISLKRTIEQIRQELTFLRQKLTKTITK